jgi:hypothetical protein
MKKKEIIYKKSCRNIKQSRIKSNQKQFKHTSSTIELTLCSKSKEKLINQIKQK